MPEVRLCLSWDPDAAKDSKNPEAVSQILREIATLIRKRTFSGAFARAGEEAEVREVISPS